MFDFLFKRQSIAVRRVLQGRLNRTTMQHLHDGPRKGTRGMFAQVVSLTPYGRDDAPDVFASLPVVTKDISEEGLALLVPCDVPVPHVLVGLRDTEVPVFLRCQVEHSTPLGFGFHQVGLHPVEVVALDPPLVDEVERYLEQNRRPATFVSAVDA
jgi:hypothetical protein